MPTGLTSNPDSITVRDRTRSGPVPDSGAGGGDSGEGDKPLSQISGADDLQAIEAVEDAGQTTGYLRRTGSDAWELVELPDPFLLMGG